MSAADGIAVAVMFVWLGMVVAISFMEAPLKFRAPGVSLQVGLGIGRLVFRALNTAEVALAVPLLIAIAADPPSLVAVVAVGVVLAALATQLRVVRPMLSRRPDAVLAASVPAFTAPVGSSRRSRTHYGYVALELVKVVALIVGGVALLAA